MVQVPAIRGVIDRRILVNYQVDPDALATDLPAPFEPWTVDGYGVGGICLIRLADARPRPLPAALGMTFENAAHRIGVEWTEDGVRRRGVYVPRRDSSSKLNAVLGSYLFSGNYHEATFDVAETDAHFAVEMESTDGAAHVAITADRAGTLPDDSVFESIDDASEFFRDGSLGYSPGNAGDQYEGVELCTDQWSMTPLDVRDVTSSYFETDDRFAADAVQFDSALLMENVDHEWQTRAPVCPA
jgi:hypothetical protein